jgi:hypothetical protein
MNDNGSGLIFSLVCTLIFWCLLKWACPDFIDSLNKPLNKPDTVYIHDTVCVSTYTDISDMDSIRLIFVSSDSATNHIKYHIKFNKDFEFNNEKVKK